MVKAMVVRAGSGWGKALVKQLIEANAEVVAYSGSQRKLDTLKTNLSSPLLRTVRGEAGRSGELLAAASGVDVIFCGVHLTYDDKPENVYRMLEAVRSVSAAIGAKLVVVEGVYSPSDVNVKKAVNLPGPNKLHIFSPELYGSGASNTLIHYALRKFVHGKTIKLPLDPSVRRDYLFIDDAARYVCELASTASAYGHDWNLRGNGPISQAELLGLASSVVQAAPRFEPIGGWQQRLLQWYAPSMKLLLDSYEQRGSMDETLSMVYEGIARTPYQEGIAFTVRRMLDTDLTVRKGG
ncbi:hypothetical protein PCCS19_08180 [Paenibacillus sp. CCS19]|uniref:NAD-dependent epimerase/dehydratase family protein n=1 Tax=Paenibacillus sp. CCS19 TaxID=3158387 RepID=UPI002562DC29|nr:NAD-dependent epimerase/dehydratase family protein [Paenibacillus cellulosilyticus]GMK37764.1 hypothetical protein PCCS19_08180 [Paenibacillus cellulosilyticus]